ncbi:hypothetical protein VE00_08691 [Pseudogymnoascus sp. WSF 3629]|nr:hypothetical protein VE00_08691 [Pseudogymnoascus sp. WSF 3629]
MHLETILYMLLQSDKIRPPTVIKPDFEGAVEIAEAARVPNEWFEIPEQTITIGLDDSEDNSGPDHHFGWVNEKPPRKVVVPAFEAQARPITNEEYARYLEQTHNLNIPASWVEKNVAQNGYPSGYTNEHSNGYANGNSCPSAPLSQSYLEGKSVRTVYGPVPLKFSLDWPVSASYDELAGCAKWMGGSIPTLKQTKSIYQYADASRRHYGTCGKVGHNF